VNECKPLAGGIAPASGVPNYSGDVQQYNSKNQPRQSDSSMWQTSAQAQGAGGDVHERKKHGGKQQYNPQQQQSGHGQGGVAGRGLHSSTFQLNLSRF